MLSDKMIDASIKREKQEEDYYCPLTDRPILQKMMYEIKEKMGMDIEYIAQIDHLNLRGAGIIYANYINRFTSESIRAYLIPQIVSDRVSCCAEIVLNAYIHFKNSKEYISGKGEPAPAHIYVRYDNAIRQLKPKKKTSILLDLASQPRDAFYLPLTMRLIASWKPHLMEDILFRYLESEGVTADSIGLPEQHEGYYPSLPIVKRELLFTAIYGLRYYMNEENISRIQMYMNCEDRDISEAAQNTMAYYRRHR